MLLAVSGMLSSDTERAHIRTAGWVGNYVLFQAVRPEIGGITGES